MEFNFNDAFDLAKIKVVLVDRIIGFYPVNVKGSEAFVCRDEASVF